jgi:TolA-binding protein
VFAAGYLIKAGIAAEELGDNAKALSFYKEVKDQYANAPEAMEIDKYITRLENAE